MEYLKPCPRCCCTEVEWTNSRDLGILTSYVQCLRCYYKGDKPTTDNNGQCNSPQECEVNCE